MLSKIFDEMHQLKASNQEIKASNQEIKASNQEIKASNQEIKASNQEIKASNQEIKGLVSYSLSLSVEANFKCYNPWEHLSKKSGSKKETRINEHRQGFEIFYGMTKENQKCMLTGGNGKLKLAHLLPLNVSDAIAKSLDIKGRLNDYRNCLLLSEHVEEAYDSLRISFVPSANVLQENEFVMKIWDETVLDEGIFNNVTTSNRKIGEFIDKPLELMVNGQVHRPFKRVLAFHNFICFMKWSIYSGELKEDIKDFGSEHKGSWLKDRDYYLNSLQTRLVRDDVDEDVDDVKDIVVDDYGEDIMHLINSSEDDVKI
jgi:hypothetical protein